MSAAPAQSTLSAAARLGERLFADKSLSASGRMSCASCHDPALGHGSPFDTPTAPGGAALEKLGGRKPPAIRYLRFNGPFKVASDGTPSGGFFWDGRAASLDIQATRPLLNPVEMANESTQALLERLLRTSYVEEFRAVFGDEALRDPDVALARIGFAIAQYQREDPDFAPFSSKYDAFLAGRVALEAAELRGLALFNSPAKGNCAACHPSARGADGRPPLFTDFSYDALGVPRNPALPANADAGFMDMGLCGPTRTELANRLDLCGAFKVPSLRNVGLARFFFHNGRFSSLEDVVRFYVTRDTDSARWYPGASADGPLPYDDLPETLRGNVNTTEGPYDRRGGSPALNDAEILDLVAFLRTLTDGWQQP